MEELGLSRPSVVLLNHCNMRCSSFLGIFFFQGLLFFQGFPFLYWYFFFTLFILPKEVEFELGRRFSKFSVCLACIQLFTRLQFNIFFSYA